MSVCNIIRAHIDKSLPSWNTEILDDNMRVANSLHLEIIKQLKNDKKPVDPRRFLQLAECYILFQAYHLFDADITIIYNLDRGYSGNLNDSNCNPKLAETTLYIQCRSFLTMKNQI